MEVGASEWSCASAWWSFDRQFPLCTVIARGMGGGQLGCAGAVALCGSTSVVPFTSHSLLASGSFSSAGLLATPRPTFALLTSPGEAG